MEMPFHVRVFLVLFLIDFLFLTFLFPLMKTPKPLRIALLFDGNKVFDREIIAGIGDYLRSTRVSNSLSWLLFLDEEFKSRPEEILNWEGDGIIANVDDPLICQAMQREKRPLVAVGDCLFDDYFLPKTPYIESDHQALITLAYQHLVESGVTNFAFYSKPPQPENRWAQAREGFFRALMQQENNACEIFQGHETRAKSANEAQNALENWLKNLPKPVGIIAVNDARARLLLQAANAINASIPDEIAIVGIDNDPLTQTLTRVALSSVEQGTRQMGFAAAEMLHKKLQQPRANFANQRILPLKLHIRASSLRDKTGSPRVMRARHFIAQFLAQGIKADQVASYVGVSRSLLENEFKQHLQCSIYAEILRARLQLAQNLIAENTLGMGAIAKECGFSSLPYLHAVFRRELGCTPGEFRARQQN